MRATTEIQLGDKTLSDILLGHASWLQDSDTGTCANLSSANLRSANGIMLFGPIGKHLRIGYAVLHADCIMFQLGCHWGSLPDTCAAIVEKYGENSDYERMVKLCAEILESQR